MPRRDPTAWGEIALLVCAAGWGATFPLTRSALDHASPLALLSVRFLLATLLLSRNFFRSGPAALKPALGAGIALGSLLSAGYMLQTFGLTVISASRSAFLTAFYVLFTPFIEWGVTRLRPPARTMAGALLALLGAAVMTGGAAGQLPSWGDLITLLCALVYSVQIVSLGRALERHPPHHLLFLQVSFCGLACLLASLLFESPRFDFHPSLLMQVLYLSVIGTVVLLSLQNFGQARTSPSRAAILFATEPVWAAFFAAFAGERLGTPEIAGALLVLAGILISTLSKKPVGP